MVDPATIDLARRALACPRWRWMPRMADQLGRTVLAIRDGMCLCAWWFGPIGAERPASGWVRIEQMGEPDLDDPATVGCLEALVQQALGHDGVNVVVEVRWSPAARGYRLVWWTCNDPIALGLDDHPTKIAALVTALEAAPR